jgi:hypothetical protein
MATVGSDLFGLDNLHSRLSFQNRLAPGAFVIGSFGNPLVIRI